MQKKRLYVTNHSEFICLTETQRSSEAAWNDLLVLLPVCVTFMVGGDPGLTNIKGNQEQKRKEAEKKSETDRRIMGEIMVRRKIGDKQTDREGNFQGGGG